LAISPELADLSIANLQSFCSRSVNGIKRERREF
jgi:hypothetical protein